MFKSLTLQYAIKLLALSKTTNNVHPSDVPLPLSRTIIIKRLHQGNDSLQTWLVLKSFFRLIPTSPSTLITLSSLTAWFRLGSYQSLLFTLSRARAHVASWLCIWAHLSPFKTNSILQGPQKQRDAHMGVLCYSTIPSTATSCPFVWVSQFNVS